MLAARCCLYLWDVFITSFFIQIGLALPMIVYFHRMSISGLTANAIIVPVLSAIVPLGISCRSRLNSHVLAHRCAWLLSVARSRSACMRDGSPTGAFPRRPSGWRPFCRRAGSGGLANETAARPLGSCGCVAGVAATLAAIVIHPFAPVVEHGKFELSAIDVGQGDSLLARLPARSADADRRRRHSIFRAHEKPGIDIGEDVVSPYLWSRSIKHLDVVAMTHAHEDHMGGMSAVLRNFHPRELWTGATQDSPEWRTVRETAERLHITIRQMRRGAPFAFGGAMLQVLAPGPDYAPDAKPKNDDSLVMRVRFGTTSFLLTGDMEKNIESELADAGLLEHDDVLKVGHHGSRTSSTPQLLDLERPAFGIISAGFDNSYGHPHPFTLLALEERKVAVYRTDERG